MSYHPGVVTLNVALRSRFDGVAKSSMRVLPPTLSRCGPIELMKNVYVPGVCRKIWPDHRHDWLSLVSPR